MGAVVMSAFVEQLPEMSRLQTGLSTVFGDGRLVVLEREPHVYCSTYPSEVVSCALADGRQLRLHCKYSADREHNCHGHRGGLTYEAAVYRTVLKPIGAQVPTFHGAYVDPETGWTWLILEHLDGAFCVADYPETMRQASSWLGRFHAAAQDWVAAAPDRSLTRYDADYYRGWVDRTLEFSQPLWDRFPWLPDLCRRFREPFDLLLFRSPTVIHGEFFVHNVLCHHGRVFAVDWESTAIGPGEIDLASLLDGWGEQNTKACLAEYQRARWPQGAPDDFEKVVDAARIYYHFRWLGEDLQPAHGAGGLPTVEELRRAAERWGFI